MEIFQISTLEERIFQLQNQIDNLLYKLNDLHKGLHDLQQDVNIFLLFCLLCFFNL